MQNQFQIDISPRVLANYHREIKVFSFENLVCDDKWNVSLETIRVTGEGYLGRGPASVQARSRETSSWRRAYFPPGVTTSQYIYIYTHHTYYSYYTIANQLFYPLHDGLSRNCLRVSRPFSRHCPCWTLIYSPFLLRAFRQKKGFGKKKKIKRWAFFGLLEFFRSRLEREFQEEEKVWKKGSGKKGTIIFGMFWVIWMINNNNKRRSIEKIIGLLLYVEIATAFETFIAARRFDLLLLLIFLL